MHVVMQESIWEQGVGGQGQRVCITIIFPSRIYMCTLKVFVCIKESVLSHYMLPPYSHDTMQASESVHLICFVLLTIAYKYCVGIA